MKRSATIEVIETCARAAHEANRAYCLAMGDGSQLPWERAPDWQRQSCVNGAKAVICEDVGPEESHQRWMEEKIAAGWKYGPIKDVEKKEHPCMVAYADLPVAQSMKDTIFGTVVRVVYGALEGYYSAARAGEGYP